MIDITMPQLGETVTEGTITRWRKAVGDRIDLDDILYEVSTEKVETEIPSPVEGWMGAILVGEGQAVPIGTRLAVVADSPDGATASETAADGPAGATPGRSTPERARTGSPLRARASTAGRSAPGRPAPGGGAAPADVLSPVVRRLLAERGLTASDVVGTGRDGRITAADVEAHRSAAAAAAPPVPTAAPARPAAPVVQPGPDDTVVPFNVVRRVTAEHMVRSLATSAHTFVSVDVDYQRVEEARATVGLSYLPFVVRALVDVLGEYPHLNASVGDDALIVHPRVHLGVAVDLGHEGLVAPVLRNAADHRLRPLAVALRDLAERARARRVGADEMRGGTFTVTNPGGAGTLLSVPIINQPQVAIVSTDGIRMKPVAVALPGGGWGVAVHPVGALALSFDHRAVDGAYAAAFLARTRHVIETRDWQGEL